MEKRIVSAWGVMAPRGKRGAGVPGEELRQRSHFVTPLGTRKQSGRRALCWRRWACPAAARDLCCGAGGSRRPVHGHTTHLPACSTSGGLVIILLECIALKKPQQTLHFCKTLRFVVVEAEALGWSGLWNQLCSPGAGAPSEVGTGWLLGCHLHLVLVTRRGLWRKPPCCGSCSGGRKLFSL